MPRIYVKRDPTYWASRKPASTFTPAAPGTPAKDFQHPDQQIEAAFDGQPHFTAVAACGGGTLSNETYRNQFAATIAETPRYANLRNGIVPFDGTSDGYWGMGDAIALATQAYFNVAIIRNAINMSVDFSISQLHIKSANKTVKRFFTNWFQSIGLESFMAQYFLEYYRSGNVFIYKFMGRIPDEKFNALRSAVGAKTPLLPIRYILLNPQQVYLQMGPSYNYTFSKMLSTYEIARLRDPKTEEDVLVLKSFPKVIQDQIKNYAAQPFLYVPLDLERLYYTFYRKQDYEPLAVPMVFPVLNDVDWKLELKRMDMSLVRSMEQALLHVSTGAPADQYNVPIGKNNATNLTKIFQNQTVGRVLVTDWTTKVEWKIPDLKELLGPAKYEQVDADIKEGLQYMFFGEEKFANATIKAKVFVESLKEGRRCFLNDFLIPEVRKVCQAMNFKNVPTLEFEEIDMSDQTATNGLYYKMAQLGLLTNVELNTALKTGVLPDEETSLEDQAKYKDARDKGLYTPVVPPMAPADGKMPGDAGRPPGIKTPLSKKTVSPIGTSKGAFDVSTLKIDKVTEVVAAINGVLGAVEAGLKAKHKVAELNTDLQFIAEGTAKALITNEPQAKWQECVASYVAQYKPQNQDTAIILDSIGAELDYGPWEALAVWASQLPE